MAHHHTSWPSIPEDRSPSCFAMRGTQYQMSPHLLVKKSFFRMRCHAMFFTILCIKMRSFRVLRADLYPKLYISFDCFTLLMCAICEIVIISSLDIYRHCKFCNLHVCSTIIWINEVHFKVVTAIQRHQIVMFLSRKWHYLSNSTSLWKRARWVRLKPTGLPNQMYSWNRICAVLALLVEL